MESHVIPYKVTIHFIDNSLPRVIHFTEPRLAVMYTIDIDDTYDSPLAQAHELAENLITRGASVRIESGAMYIPSHRVKYALVEKA